MTGDSARIREQLLDLAWSLWTGLGVPGRIDLHDDHFIDPEALIVFTAALGDSDPRLRDEATDWCIRYGNLISGARLKNLVAREGEGVNARFGEFAATVADHSSLRWPGLTTSRRHDPRPRPWIAAFDRRSMLVLRLRGLLGVGARAEIIRVFLYSPEESFNAADLAALTAYKKRNVAGVLDALRTSGILEAFPVRNALRFKMAPEARDHLRQLLAPVPRASIQWHPALHVLWAVFDAVCRFDDMTDPVRSVEMRSLAEKLEPEIRAARLPSPNRTVRGEAFWPEIINWLTNVTDSLASGDGGTSSKLKDPA